MAERDLHSAELASMGLGLSLGAQLAFAGQLLSMLITSRVISNEQACELLSKVADTITSSLDQPGSDLQALANKPLREHADALLKISADLKID